MLFSVDKSINSENICGALTGCFHVTATYTNPAGESGQSNSVTISDELPLGLTDHAIDKEFKVLFNKSLQRIEIINCKFHIKSIALYDLNGRLVVISKNRDFLLTHDLSKGIYIIKVTDTENRTLNEKIAIN